MMLEVSPPNTLQVHKHTHTRGSLQYQHSLSVCPGTPAWILALLTCFVVPDSPAGPARCLLANSQHSHTHPSCIPHSQILPRAWIPSPSNTSAHNWASSLKFESKLSTHKPTQERRHNWFGEDTDTAQHPAASTRAVPGGPALAAHAETLSRFTHTSPLRSWFWEHMPLQPLWLEVKDPPLTPGADAETLLAPVADTRGQGCLHPPVRLQYLTPSPLTPVPPAAVNACLQHTYTQEREWHCAERELRKNVVRW